MLAQVITSRLLASGPSGFKTIYFGSIVFLAMEEGIHSWIIYEEGVYAVRTRGLYPLVSEDNILTKEEVKSFLDKEKAKKIQHIEDQFNLLGTL